MGSKRRRSAASAAADEAPKESVKAVATPPAKADDNVKPKKKSKTASAVETHVPPPIVSAAAPTADTDGKKKKKKKKSKSSGPAASPAPTPAKPADKPTLKKKSNEIDDLFQSLKSKKKEQIEAEEKQKLDEKKALAKQKKEKKLLEEQIKKLEAAMRYDEDGLPIYTEDSLKINQGGDTADCPFDCCLAFGALFPRNTMTKRRADADSEAAYVSPLQQQIGFSSASPVAKRSPQEFATRLTAGDATRPIQMARQVDIRAYGLEDRAEAVIAMGKSNWSLANLSKWRNDSLADVDGNNTSHGATQQQQPQSSKEYLRQRQRAYMKQCLAGNKSSSQ